MWRTLAEEAEAAGIYSLASEAYAREADCWEAQGNRNEAYVERRKSNRWATRIELFHWRPAKAEDKSRLSTGARLEPAVGCLIGAFIDRDDNAGRLDLEGQRYGNPTEFARLTGRTHASHFMYRGYGQPFPMAWARELKDRGIIPQIAWEPSSLAQVQDDSYLNDFVEDVKGLDWPVFIRFAGEMNGDWTGYGGNPAAYIQKFRLVSKKFRRAPKAAMVWCPNTVPESKQDLFYPGDDAVDWVGVNMYSVLYADDRMDLPEADLTHLHPEDLLDRIYRKYKDRKPIAIGEYAATQRARSEGRDRTDFAVLKMKQLYRVLGTRYPRVKLISWYDCDNIRVARPGRQLNNYLLTEPARVLQTYKNLVSDPWFLAASTANDRGPSGQSAGWVAVPVQDGSRLNSADMVEAVVRSYVDKPQVHFVIDGIVMRSTSDPGAARLALEELELGEHRLEVHAHDGARCAGRVRMEVEVR